MCILIHHPHRLVHLSLWWRLTLMETHSDGDSLWWRLTLMETHSDGDSFWWRLHSAFVWSPAAKFGLPDVSSISRGNDAIRRHLGYMDGLSLPSRFCSICRSMQRRLPLELFCRTTIMTRLGLWFFQVLIIVEYWDNLGRSSGAVVS
jgi:hypothetical protein